MPPETIATSEQHPAEENRKEIFPLITSGDFFAKRDALEKKGLLEKEIERVKSENETDFEAPFLTQEDWEMLTVLELYDRPTFEHSVRVAQSLQKALEGSSRATRLLHARLRRAGLGSEDLIRSGFLHDIGKTAIPREILHNEVRDESWKALLQNLIEIKKWDGLTAETDPELADYEEKLRCIEEDGERCKDHVPLWLGLLPQELDRLPQHIDPARSLGEAIKPHQEESVRILTEYAKGTSNHEYAKRLRCDALLAGSHHAPTSGPDLALAQYPIIVSALRAADIYDAVRHPRAYHSGHSELRTLSILIDETERGALDYDYMRSYVEDAIRNGEAGKELHAVKAGDSDFSSAEQIKSFLRLQQLPMFERAA